MLLRHYLCIIFWLHSSSSLFLDYHLYSSYPHQNTIVDWKRSTESIRNGKYQPCVRIFSICHRFSSENRFIRPFHQLYVNDYFLKCVGGNPISLLARFSFNQCSWIVSNSISPFSLDDANGNLIFCQSWTTQELLSKIPSMIFIYNFLIVSSKRLCTKWGVIVH